MAYQDLTQLYPEIEPYNTGFLKVSDLHTVYYEQSGNSSGNPVSFIHGGPGGETTPSDRRYFDPNSYRIILMDQRGCGKSTPTAELKDNTTWTLLEDIESVRNHLGIGKWVVFGGSWGSTLSLLYAEEYPERVKALILRGIYANTWKESIWLNQEGASMLFPDHFEDFVAPIPEVERGDLLSAYHRRLTGSDQKIKLECARAWIKWETSIIKLISDDDVTTLVDDDPLCLASAVLECHYAVYGGWLKSPNHILDNVDKIRHIPGVIIQGRYDMVCPFQIAWELHKKWPEAEFHIIPDAGHSSKEKGIAERLVAATNKFRNI